MITREELKNYKGAFLSRESDSLYVLPHILLRPYISCYTISFPVGMPDEFTVLPTASSRFVFALDENGIHSSIVGINTKAISIGKYASKMEMLLLIEFHTGGFYPFVKPEQHELVDISFNLTELDKSLSDIIKIELIKSKNIKSLFTALDGIFLRFLANFHEIRIIAAMKNEILARSGNMTTKELSSIFHYSERHIRRLFLRYIGTSPKIFSRIVRINYVLNLLQSDNTRLIDITMKAGFFDQAHFIHDFKSVCGITPLNYIKDMSLFYNDEFKI